MANGIIYKITAPSGKCYIGQTIFDLEHRKKQHLSVANNTKLKAYSLPICGAIRKYKEQLRWEVLEELSRDQLDITEQQWIQKFDSFNKGYNCTPGGDFNPSRLLEVRRKIGQATKIRMQNYKPSDSTKKIWSEQRKGSGNPMFGRTHTLEARAKISKAAFGHSYNKGRKHTLEARHRMSKSRIGKTLSESHKQNIRKAAQALNRPGKPVQQINLEGEILKTFPSLKAAARHIRETTAFKKAASSEIKVAAREQHRVRYGYHWRFKNG